MHSIYIKAKACEPSSCFFYDTLIIDGFKIEEKLYKQDDKHGGKGKRKKES